MGDIQHEPRDVDVSYLDDFALHYIETHLRAMGYEVEPNLVMNVLRLEAEALNELGYELVFVRNREKNGGSLRNPSNAPMTSS
ncbi:hypothetical protein [Alicyclobacillus shizuokensis]|uniref:hypothetical protein n=1 Tax=Alicyclobacillus shizuokensis TaxID=392014 RepID=UPI000829ACD3|nr:hypothetical protein [Alicyclobacillus shizuokensis]